MSNPTPQSDRAMQAILESSRLVCSSLNLEEVLRRTISAVQALSGADVATVFLRDHESDSVELHAAVGVAEGRHLRFRLGEGMAGWVAQTGQPLHLVRPEADSRYRPAFARLGNILALPLKVRDRILGVLCISYHGRAEYFPAETVRMIEIFASHAAIAIDNAETVSRLRRAAAYERLLNLVDAAIKDPTSIRSFLRRALVELGMALEAPSCAILQAQAEDYTVVESWSSFDPPAPADLPAPPVGPRWQPQPFVPGFPRTGRLEFRIVAEVGIPDHWLVIDPDRPGRRWGRDDVSLAASVVEQIGALLRSYATHTREQRNREIGVALSELAAAAAAQIDRASILELILEQLQRLVAFDSAAIFLLQGEDFLRMIAGRGFPFSGDEEVILHVDPGGLCDIVLSQRQPLHIADVQQIDSWQSVPGSELIRGWIGVPLMVNGHPIGIITIDRWHPGGFSVDDVTTAQLFAEHMSVAIYNIQLLREAQERAGQLQAIHRLSARLGTIRETGPLFDAVARVLHETFGYYQVLILQVRDQTLLLRAAYGRVNDISELEFLRQFPLSHGLTGWAARHGETVLVNDVSRDERYARHPRLADTASELVVPIKLGEQVLGVIDLQSHLRGDFSRNDVYLLEALAAQAAVTLENIRHDDELRLTRDLMIHGERLRALGQLSSGIAHDFNNLLTSILGHAQLLLDGAPGAEMTEALRTIERAALDGAATVRRLQSFTRTRQPVPEEAVDINRIVEESLAITRPRWRDLSQGQGLQIAVTSILGSIPPIAGDGPALRELVTNLILNAVDAMPEGGTLELRTGSDTEEGRPVVFIEVRDSGIGIAPELQERIFLPFFTTKGTRGTGMGLAMAYGVAERHQGRITVESMIGCGSCFRVVLPARLPTLPAGLPAPEGAISAAPMRALVVDDEEEVRATLMKALRRWGHTVVGVGSGSAAAALVHREPFDLVCTDLGMPGMSGWEVVRMAREALPNAILLLITGWGDQINEADAEAYGADGIVAKPYNLADLRRLIATLRAGQGARHLVSPPITEA